MAEEKFLTVRDVSLILGVSEKEIVDLVETGSLPAYRIGGVYLRFKKAQVFEFKNKSPVFSPRLSRHQAYPFKDRLGDFLYFNDFYILAAIVIISLLVIIFRGY
ncbi:MAG: helix-turn-helix domain-containing protein [Candidatus Omnitrophota bacterium]